MIKIYSTSSCNYCVKAKQFLESKDINYIEVNIGQDDEAKTWLLAQGHRSVPQIYKDGILIEGGYDGLLKTQL
jgi:glutaredoxin